MDKPEPARREILILALALKWDNRLTELTILLHNSWSFRAQRTQKMTGSYLTSVVDYINEHGKKSCRKLARIFKRSKSSVHRYQQKVKARAHMPGAVFFETLQGQAWLKRLVVAVVFVFGISAGVGSEKLSLFPSTYLSLFQPAA